VRISISHADTVRIMIVLYKLTDLAFIGKGIKMYPEPVKGLVLIMFNSVLKPMNRTIEYVRKRDNRMVFDRHLELLFMQMRLVRIVGEFRIR
jgi:hypothetical protein